jgi:hypothetical protein
MNRQLQYMYVPEMEDPRQGGSKKPRSRSASYVPAWRRGLPKTAKKLAKKSGAKKQKAVKVVGTKAQVYHGTALRTKNNLTKADLMRRTTVVKNGKNKGKTTTRIVTRKGHERANKADMTAKINLKNRASADRQWAAMFKADRAFEEKERAEIVKLKALQKRASSAERQWNAVWADAARLLKRRGGGIHQPAQYLPPHAQAQATPTYGFAMPEYYY